MIRIPPPGRWLTFLADDLWHLELSGLTFARRQVFKVLRIICLTFQGFKRDELTLRASGLTFWTLLSLAPLLAFVFTVFKGMGRDKEMVARFEETIAEMPSQVQDLLKTVVSYVEESSTVGIGSMALAILLYSVLRMMSNIEYSFNQVWGIGSTRPFIRKVTDYVSTLVLAPMLMIGAGALSGFTSTAFWQGQPELVHLTWGRLLMLTPLFAAWIAFCSLYIIMPNTRVRLGPAAFSSLVAAVGWIAWQKFYVNFQGMLLGQQDKVFGAFASVPIFMFWLYVCWIVVLFGCELAFAMQNFTTYAREQQADGASQASRLLLALATVREIAAGMVESRGPFQSAVFARERGIPIRLLNDVLGVLEDAGLVAEVNGQAGSYSLLRSPGRITVREVLDVVLSRGAGPDRLGLEELNPAVRAAWARASEGLSAGVEGVDFETLATQTDEVFSGEGPVPSPVRNPIDVAASKG